MKKGKNSLLNKTTCVHSATISRKDVRVKLLYISNLINCVHNIMYNTYVIIIFKIKDFA